MIGVDGVGKCTGDFDTGPDNSAVYNVYNVKDMIGVDSVGKKKKLRFFL